MFLPIGDSPNPPGTPYVNYLLIGLNIAVFILVTMPLSAQGVNPADPLLDEYLRAFAPNGVMPSPELLQQISAYDLFVFRYGFRPAEFSVVTLFSAMFLHANWMHLFGNMLFLWIYGDNVEHRLGRIGYPLAYLLTGILSTLFFSMFTPGSDIPMIGASGAISGVLGCYFIWFKRNQVKVFILLFPFIMNVFMIPARVVLGIYLVIDNLFPFLLTSPSGGGVAYGAHIGGFIGGMALAYGLDRMPGFVKVRRMAREPNESKQERDRESTLTPAQAIAAHLREGDYDRAVRHYLALTDRRERIGINSDVVLALGEYLLGTRSYDEALTLFRRFIAERPDDREIDRAFLGAGKAMIHQPRHIPSAYQYFLSAIDAARDRQLADEARMHLRAIERLGDDDR